MGKPLPQPQFAYLWGTTDGGFTGEAKPATALREPCHSSACRAGGWIRQGELRIALAPKRTCDGIHASCPMPAPRTPAQVTVGAIGNRQPVRDTRRCRDCGDTGGLFCPMSEDGEGYHRF